MVAVLLRESVSLFLRRHRAIWVHGTEKGKPEMSTKLHVGNLSRYTTEADLTNPFNRVGLVLSAALSLSMKGVPPRRSGFVGMTGEGTAPATIQAFNGFMFQELPLSVNEA